MGGACSTHGRRRGVHRILVGKPEGKIPLERTRSRWKGNIKWIFRKWGVGTGDRSSCLRIGTGSGHL